jgi:hypothetical protein
MFDEVAAARLVLLLSKKRPLKEVVRLASTAAGEHGKPRARNGANLWTTKRRDALW